MVRAVVRVLANSEKISRTRQGNNNSTNVKLEELEVATLPTLYIIFSHVSIPPLIAHSLPKHIHTQMAANILKEMRAAGHALDTCTLNHALSVLTLAQRTRQAFEFYEAMFQSGTGRARGCRCGGGQSWRLMMGGNILIAIRLSPHMAKNIRGRA